MEQSILLVRSISYTPRFRTTHFFMLSKDMFSQADITGKNVVHADILAPMDEIDFHAFALDLI